MKHQVSREVIALWHALSSSTWRKLLGYFGLYVLPVVLFVALADEVIDNDTLSIDSAILHGVNSWFSSPAMDSIVLALTDLGYTWWVGGLTILGVILLIYRKQRRSAIILMMGVVGSAVMNLILKAFFQRDRPELWERLVTENSTSFPSGHAMASASLAVCVMVILWPTKWRYLAIISGVIYMVVIGFTRLYLGVHYPSDIIAGWLIASFWVFLVAGVIRHWHFKKT